MLVHASVASSREQNWRWGLHDNGRWWSQGYQRDTAADKRGADEEIAGPAPRGVRLNKMSFSHQMSQKSFFGKFRGHFALEKVVLENSNLFFLVHGVKA